MKLIELKCPNCGANIEADLNINEVTCKYCKSTFNLRDDSEHIKFDNMEQSGYEFEKGRIRARKEHEKDLYSEQFVVDDNNSTIINKTQTKLNEDKKRNTILLILAWIFLLPFTATYFIVKTNKIDKNAKIIIITIMWLLVIVICIVNSYIQKENLKKMIVECYSEDVYNQLDDNIGIDNIESNLTNSTTCSNFKMKDKNYDEIIIGLDSNNKIIYIKTKNKIYYEGK